MARPKIKKFSEKGAFFVEFSHLCFNFLLILMQKFEKLPQILGLCQIVKFRSTLEKSDPKHFGDPVNRKILHKLLLELFQHMKIIFGKLILGKH